MNILWITPKWPLSITDGARVAISELIHKSTQLGANIHLASFVSTVDQIEISTAKEILGVSAVTLIKKGKATHLDLLKNLILKPWIPVTQSPFSNDQIQSQYSKLIIA